MLKDLPPDTRPLRKDGIRRLPLLNPPPQLAPVQCASGLDGLYYEVIQDNSGIHHFVWEHLNDVNRVLQRIKKAGGTFSGWKMDICMPEVITIGHKCTYNSRYPEDQKVQKILDWPNCTSLMEVRGFLGICGIVQIWVKDFAKRAKPLVLLTKKNVELSGAQNNKPPWRTL